MFLAISHAIIIIAVFSIAVMSFAHARAAHFMQKLHPNFLE